MFLKGAGRKYANHELIQPDQILHWLASTKNSPLDRAETSRYGGSADNTQPSLNLSGDPR
jgi:hypothetical protein